MAGRKLPESAVKSPEIQEKLDIYLALLRKWQKSVNLVSNNTIDEAQQRHFADSQQLAEHVPDNVTLFDLGSGAGFPGLVLAMIRPDLNVTLVESDTKKCTFLSTVSRETKTPVNIINERIENVSCEIIPAIVTARALASLDKLLGYCEGWAQENRALEMLFLKGARAQEEIEIAKEIYSFDIAVLPSKTAADSAILKVTNLHRNSVS